MKKLITLWIVSILAIGLTGCTPAEEQPIVSEESTVTEQPESEEIISYSTQGVPVNVSKESKSFDYTVSSLEAMAEECGAEHDAGYFDDLVSKFSGSEKTVYNFKYDGASQESDTYVVAILPNIMEYKTLEEFKKDFDICAAGGNAYPVMLNDDWLLFQNSCGSGFSDDSGNPNGCAEVQKVVEPTVQFN